MMNAKELIANALAQISIRYMPESHEHRVLHEAITMILHPEDYEAPQKEPAHS